MTAPFRQSRHRHKLSSRCRAHVLSLPAATPSASPSGVKPSASPSGATSAASSPDVESTAVPPDELLHAGLLAEAESGYEALLDSQDGAVVKCARAGLLAAEQQRQLSVQWEAEGDQAAAEGNLGAAETDYQNALTADRGNAAALTSLQTIEQESPNSIRQARDFWNQIVSNTLVPIGQFFLWLLAIGAGVYFLYLLTRIGAERLRLLPARPSWRPALSALRWVCFTLALAAAGATAYIGVDTSRAGGLWIGCLIAAAVLVLVGCLLLAWYLRSGTGIQFTVTDDSSDADKTASAYLAGILAKLGQEPPRGFELPQNTDVTGLTGLLTVLPGGGVLSALATFLLAKVPVTPWTAAVTLIDDDQLLVTMYHNGRPLPLVTANRGELFFPSPVAGQDADGPSPFVKDIDRNGMLTIAAAVILVSMGGKDPPLQHGLNGATRWQSVAGQVLATDQGFGGDQARSKALLARAVDADPGNLTAVVAKTVMDGRRAKDADGRQDFADKISEIWGCLKSKRDYQALQLRVLYSAAAGWTNVYLDHAKRDDLEKALKWATKLINQLDKPGKPRRLPFRSTSGPLRKMAEDMKPSVYMLGAALDALRGRCVGNPAPISLPLAYRRWEPTDGGQPQTSAEMYAKACLEAAENKDDDAVKCLKQATGVDDDLRTWARWDPSFEHFDADANKEYVDIVSGPGLTDFTGVGPLADYAAKLTDIGVHTADDLIDQTDTAGKRKLVAQAVGVSPLVIARWRDIALLCHLPKPPDPGQLNALVAQGVDSQKALKEKTCNRDASDKLFEGITSATKNSRVAITKRQLMGWAEAPTVQR